MSNLTDLPANSPGSDISPMTQVPKIEQTSPNISPKTNAGYFEATGQEQSQESASGASITSSSGAASSGASNGASNQRAHIQFADADADRRPSNNSNNSSVELDLPPDVAANSLRKLSTASVSFRAPSHNLPQGQPKQERRKSPAPTRFRKHVGFDNIPLGEATKYNTLGYTLSVSHYGYRPQKHSRTVMVGVDQNVYSDFALQWLVEEYADDGDEIICVHVVDKDARSEEKNYKVRADKMVERIKSKIPENRAIGFKLEYAVGKLHDTFQKLILVYQPSMLVVGTRGRSLGGIQGLVTKNSFSKYCLQYSPVPTVVVRDYEKRKKKKEKRSNDPTRQTYTAMLARTNGVHEANLETSSVYDMEARISPDEEAHRVAAAIGLPAKYDPTLKPIDIDQVLGRRSRTSSPAPGAGSLSPASRSPRQMSASGLTPTSTIAPSPLSEGVSAISAIGMGELRSGSGEPLDVVPDKESVESEDDDSGDDDDDSGGFDVMSGAQALQRDGAGNGGPASPNTEGLNRSRLHNMESDEGQALRHKAVEEEDDDEDSKPA